MKSRRCRVRRAGGGWRRCWRWLSPASAARRARRNPDGGDGSIGDLKPNTDTPSGDRADVGGADSHGLQHDRHAEGARATRARATASAPVDFCADGVCCDQACNEGCKTCNAPDTVGNCVMRTAGDDPRDSSTCTTMPASTCGLDGKCDGAGGCRKYPENTQCKSGTCDGDAVVGVVRLRRQRSLQAGCDAHLRAVLVQPGHRRLLRHVHVQQPVRQRPGLRAGKLRQADDRRHLRDRRPVRVRLLRRRRLLQRRLQGRLRLLQPDGPRGTCWPIDADAPDPPRRLPRRGRRRAAVRPAPATASAAARSTRATRVCVTPTCSGSRREHGGDLQRARHLPGPGHPGLPPVPLRERRLHEHVRDQRRLRHGHRLRQQHLRSEAGRPVVHGGRPNASTTTASTASAATRRAPARAAAARSPRRLGRCTPIAVGATDPRAMCKADGAEQLRHQRQVRRQRRLPELAGRHPVRRRDLHRQRLQGRRRRATPAASAWRRIRSRAAPTSATARAASTPARTNAQCLTPNTCAMNSCGKKDHGAIVLGARRVQEQLLRAGRLLRHRLHRRLQVVRRRPCSAYCTQRGHRGERSRRHVRGPGPVDAAAPTASARRAPASGRSRGTACRAASCPTATPAGDTARRPATAPGPASRPRRKPCFPYQCGSDACKPSCTADADCPSPAVCMNGSCGLKPNGAVCLEQERVPLDVLRAGRLLPDRLHRHLQVVRAHGVARDVQQRRRTATADVMSRCADQGRDELQHRRDVCDGNGACRLYDASTSCAAPSCPPNQSTAVSGRTCDGLGVCQPATTIPARPTSATERRPARRPARGDGDCLSPNICDPQDQPLRQQARASASRAPPPADCLTGNFCVDGVCCSSSACSLCQVVQRRRQRRQLRQRRRSAARHDEPLRARTRPAATPAPATARARCQLAATDGLVRHGVVHRIDVHADLALQRHRRLRGADGLQLHAVRLRRRTRARPPARSTATVSRRTPARARRPTGAARSSRTDWSARAGNQCISGNCIDGVCCGSAGCAHLPDLQRHRRRERARRWRPARPRRRASAPASPPCGNTGTCNGASGCQQAGDRDRLRPGRVVHRHDLPAGVDLHGQRHAAASSRHQSCGAYVCGSTTPARPAAPPTRTARAPTLLHRQRDTPGSCAAKKAQRRHLRRRQRVHQRQLHRRRLLRDRRAARPARPATAPAPGTCANVGDGTPSRRASCAASAACGNTGVCNGAAAASSSRRRPPAARPQSCTGDDLPAAVDLLGDRHLQPDRRPRSCGAYVCGGNACKTSCTADTRLQRRGSTAPAREHAGSCVGQERRTAPPAARDNQCAQRPLHRRRLLRRPRSCRDLPDLQPGTAPGTCANVGHTPAASPTGAAPNTGVVRQHRALRNGGGACQQQPATIACGCRQSCARAALTSRSRSATAPAPATRRAPISCGAYVCTGRAPPA